MESVKSSSSKPLGLLVLAIILMCSKAESQLGADPMSLMRIVQRLCGAPHDEMFATQFYNCYGLLDQKEQCLFEKCQKQSFGYTLNTKANIESSCTANSKLPQYTNCLMTEFNACNRDVVKAVTTINICQGRLLGLE